MRVCININFHNRLSSLWCGCGLEDGTALTYTVRVHPARFIDVFYCPDRGFALRIIIPTSFIENALCLFSTRHHQHARPSQEEHADNQSCSKAQNPKIPFECNFQVE